MANWLGLIIKSVSDTTVTVTCAYRFDTGSLPSVYTLTTGTAAGDANVTYRIRGALSNVAPLLSTVSSGASSTPTTSAFLSSVNEVRMFLQVYGWSAGTVSTTGYGTGLSYYLPVYPGIQSQWNNAAGTGIFSAYRSIAEDQEGFTALNFGGSVTSVRFTIIVQPSNTVPASIDYTPLWIVFALFLILLGLGLAVHPIFQFMAGLAGFALTFELFTLTSDTLLASITAFMAIAVLITSTLRDWR